MCRDSSNERCDFRGVFLGQNKLPSWDLKRCVGTLEELGKQEPAPGDLELERACEICHGSGSGRCAHGGCVGLSVRFEHLPDVWRCPMCGAPKSAYEKHADGRGSHGGAAVTTDDVYTCSACKHVYGRPPSDPGYSLFYKERKAEVKDENPGFSGAEITQEFATMWDQRSPIFLIGLVTSHP